MIVSARLMKRVHYAIALSNSDVPAEVNRWEIWRKAIIELARTRGIDVREYSCFAVAEEGDNVPLFSTIHSLDVLERHGVSQDEIMALYMLIFGNLRE